MSYKVFALKWRPKIFDEIIGQPHIVNSLKNAIKQQRLANAYLFSGPRGVGKTSTARIFAKALNCREGFTAEPCGRCPACLEISEGRSLDVIEIDGASNRGIDEIRVLRENVKFAPASGRFKVYIIDEVHQITTDGFNALLKTLEEPPPYVKFIFATTHPHKVIPTIVSRCQRFDFRRISVMEITSQLERITASEHIEVDKEVLSAIARSSDGSLRDAESVLDQLVSFSKGKVSLKDVVSVLGLVEQEALFEVTDKIINKDPRAALAIFNRIVDDGKDPGVFLANLIEHFRNLMIAKVSKGDAKLIDLPQDICESLLKQSSGFSLEDIFIAFNILVSAQEMAKRLDSLRIPLEISLVRLAQDKKNPGPVVSAPVQKSAPEIKQPPIQSIRHEPAKERPAAQEQKQDDGNDVPQQEISNSISLENVKDAWQRVIENLAGIKMSVATYLNEGEPVKMHADVLTVAFPKNLSQHKESLERKDNKTLIENSVSGLLNARLRINFILSAEQKQKESHENNPFIRSALDMFGGRIIGDGNA